MADHFSHYLLWRALMFAQKNNIATEKSLLDCAKFWWYDGYEGFNTDHQEKKMKLALECLSLFLVGVAYGAVAEAYARGVQYRMSRIRARK